MIEQQIVNGVFDSNLNPMFEGAGLIKASIKPSAELMRHPLESGAIRTDNRIFNPTTAEMSFMLSPATYKDVYQEIKDAYESMVLLTVQTKVDTYPNMSIASTPYEITGEVIDTVAVTIQLVEVLLITAQFQPLPPRKVKNRDDASTVDRGEQAPQQKTSTLGDWAKDL